MHLVQYTGVAQTAILLIKTRLPELEIPGGLVCPGWAHSSGIHQLSAYAEPAPSTWKPPGKAEG